MNTIKPAFQSSIDPTQLSLSVSSGTKTIIGIIGVLVAYKGLDVTSITSQLQAIVDMVVTAIPAGFAVWHAMLTVYGLIRKFTVVKA